MKRSIKKIVITGPESTGKTTLCGQLANQYHTVWIPEYARGYIESLNRPYTYGDVELIARKQIGQEQEYLKKANEYLFYDTFLIITKVWLLFVYKFCPEWINEYIKRSKIDLFLLCDIDLPWFPDKVRENGGEMRKVLFERYRQELEYYGFKYRIVNGLDEKRLTNATAFINEI